MAQKPGKFIRNFKEFENYISVSQDMSDAVIQDIDFTQKDLPWDQLKFHNTTFLGCIFKRDTAFNIISSGAYVYPKFKDLPYNPYRQNLYSWQELMEGHHPKNDQSLDYKIYQHFCDNKFNPPVNEALAQRIHDHSIDDALRALLGYDQYGMTNRKAVGFMGGHSIFRGSEFYNKVAYAAKWLTEKGYYIATGGGPGIMEAANLGAYFGNRNDDELSKAIEILSDLRKEDPEDNDYLAENYITQSQLVLDNYPEGQDNLAIPTWFYGHEPSNLFATHIAKYFSNSIREDTLLAISIYGVVYAPGSAGTTQEIFQEAAQNHYCTFGHYSPMVFLSKERYVEETSIYSLLHQLAKGKTYKKLLHLTDSARGVVNFITQTPPIKEDTQ